MLSNGALMRKALKVSLFPHLASLGFVGKSNDYQRVRGTTLELLAIQWGRHGGEFILEFGKRGVGPLHTSWGEIVPENAITIAHLSPLERARLVPDVPSEGLQLHGFLFEGFGTDGSAYACLAESVSTKLVQVVAWLEAGIVGPNIRPFRKSE